MKNLLIPLLIILAGIALLTYSFTGTKKVDGELDIEIAKTETIMPAAHNVYSNENAFDGKYYLFKAKLTNNTNKILTDVKVNYRIPNYIEWTEIKEIGEMFPGQSAIVRCHPKFPETITEKTTESVEKVEMEIEWDGATDDDKIEEDFDFKLASRKEFKFSNIPLDEIASWSDVTDNTSLLACFVTPNDPIVQYYTQNVQEKILKGEDATVKKDPKEGVRFMAGIYNATLLSHMVYSGTKGMPQSLQDVSQMRQENRLPREVITGNTGLCLELSLLYASIMSNAGLDPIIYLVPGHAYPGFIMNGQYYAIEATGIGGEGLGGMASAEKAFQVGMNQLDTLMMQVQRGNPQYQILNIHELNEQGAIPMTLTDNQFLREKVEGIANNWTQMASNPQPQTTPPQQAGTQIPPNQPTRSQPDRASTDNSGGGNNPNRSAASSYNIAIPSGWQVLNRPSPQLPILTAQMVSPNRDVVISVFDVNVSGTDATLSHVSQSLQNSGQLIEYSVQGNTANGVTVNSANGNTLYWVGKILNKGNSSRFVAIGSFDYVYEQNAGLINQLFNSIN